MKRKQVEARFAKEIEAAYATTEHCTPKKG
jgi:hypothetical protein